MIRDWTQHFVNATRYSIAGLIILTRKKIVRNTTIAWLVNFLFLYALPSRFADYLMLGILYLIIMAINAQKFAIENIEKKLLQNGSDAHLDIASLIAAALFLVTIAIGLLNCAFVARSISWIVW